jgi:uncharacterized protein YyaL (SSP411 family)
MNLIFRQKFKTIFILFTILTTTSCGQSDNNTAMSNDKHQYTNKLINESSPYLLQHAHNPVQWYPWGEEALEKAKKEDKLLLISIGYSACHWCHVMEHESFENEEIAAFMNKHFVAIKIDREERPDIDQVYMNAVQLLAGRGGWPLNCIALPDGRPIYGGTYFPPEQWLDMLKQVNEFVKTHPDETEEQAQKLTQGIQSQESIYTSKKAGNYDLSDLSSIVSKWKTRIDYKHGGSLGAPKFPMPVGHRFLLHYQFLTQDTDALRAVNTTLHKMANGGIYDQLAGGFARYSTDELWKAPHFEKMLYDNAQLVSLYADAFKETKDPKYLTIVLETLGFIEREMTSKEGGFYSALDADSEGEEGKYYVWTAKEMQEILGEHYELISHYYNVKENGNWEHGNNILLTSGNEKKVAEKFKLSADEFDKILADSKYKLLKEREKRIAPGLDDKILTSWNALMIKGYLDAYMAFENENFLESALKNAAFLKKKMLSKDSQLHRNYKDGKASINGFLDDYAFTISAFVALYQATFDQNWLDEAYELSKYAIAHFYDSSTDMFFYTSDLDPGLIARKMEIADNVIPSASSEMAKNLFVLGTYFHNEEYIKMSKGMLDNVREHTVDGANYYANWDVLMAWFASEPFELAIIGPDAEKLQKEFNKHYLPDVFILGGKKEGSLSLLEGKLISEQTTIYVCRGRTCQMPTTIVEEALRQIREQR